MRGGSTIVRERHDRIQHPVKIVAPFSAISAARITEIGATIFASAAGV
jgi:hypothetical protein